MYVTLSISAQNKIIIQGNVLNKESVIGLEYAHLFIEKLSVGTYTESDGSFLLVLPAVCHDDTLIISSIGYHTLKMKVSEIESDTIFLVPKTNILEEVSIVSEYNPKNILKKVYKNRKILYPYKSQYCAKAYYREYFKRNDTTVQMLELVGSIAEKGIKYHPLFGNTELTMDSIYSIYRFNDKYVYSSLRFLGMFIRDGFQNQFNGSLYVDSTFFINNEKYISIAYIPKRTDSLTYTTYSSSTNMIDKQTIEDDSVEEHMVKVVNTCQYNTIYHFIVNLKDFALVEYDYSYNLLGEPDKFGLKVNRSYTNSMKFHLEYVKSNGIYYPANIVEHKEEIFLKKKNLEEIDYKQNQTKEYVLSEFEDSCTEAILPKEYLNYSEFIDDNQDKLFYDSIIPAFENEIKTSFLDDIK